MKISTKLVCIVGLSVFISNATALGFPAINFGGPQGPPTEIQPTEQTFDGMTFVKINAAEVAEPIEFFMGSTTDHQERNVTERVHKVPITHNFWIGKYEVSQAKWLEIMGSNPSSFQLGPVLDFPVENVSWTQVKDFIAALNQTSQGSFYRLPTEAEWEYAARANRPPSFKWSFGNSENDLAFVAHRDGSRAPKTKGSKYGNNWGIHDLYGNVNEWCEDWYQSSRDVTLGGCPPANGTYKVIRGGSNGSSTKFLRASSRNFAHPDRKGYYIGFRLVRVDDPNGDLFTAAGQCITDDFCGDKSVTPPEECDDGNLVDGDGCDVNCELDIVATGVCCDPSITEERDDIYLAADNGLEQVKEKLKDMRYLTYHRIVYGEFPQNSGGETEFDQLRSDIDQIASTYTYQGTKLLNGQYLAQELNYGVEQGEKEMTSFHAVNAMGLARQAGGQGDYLTDTPFPGNFTFNVDGSSINPRTTVQSDDQLSVEGKTSSAIARAAAINSSSDFTGIKAIVEPFTMTASQAIPAFGVNATITINHVPINGITVQAQDASGTLIAAINEHTSTIGITASIDNSGHLELTSDGRNITLDIQGVSLGLPNGTQRGRLTLLSRNQFELGAAAVDAVGFQAGIYGVHTVYSLNNISVSTTHEARMALRTIDISLKQIDEMREKLIESLTEKPRTTCLLIEDQAACDSIGGVFTHSGICHDSCGIVGQCCDMESNKGANRLKDFIQPRIAKVREEYVELKNQLDLAINVGGAELEAAKETRRLKEKRIKDIVDLTKFNHRELLDGSFLARDFSYGEQPGEHRNVSIGGLAPMDLTRLAFSVSNITGDPLPASLEIVNHDNTIVSLRASQAADDPHSLEQNASSAIAKAAVINEVSQQTGVTAETTYTRLTIGPIPADGLGGGKTLTIQGVDYQNLPLVAGDADQTLTNAINGNQAQTGVEAELKADGSIELIAPDGRNISVAIAGGALNINANSIVQFAKLKIISERQFELRGTTAAATLGLTEGIYGVSSAYFGITELNNKEDAENLRQLVNLAISRLDDEVAHINNGLTTFPQGAPPATNCRPQVDANYCELRKGSFTAAPIP